MSVNETRQAMMRHTDDDAKSIERVMPYACKENRYPGRR